MLSWKERRISDSLEATRLAPPTLLRDCPEEPTGEMGVILIITQAGRYNEGISREIKSKERPAKPTLVERRKNKAAQFNL